LVYEEESLSFNIIRNAHGHSTFFMNKAHINSRQYLSRLLDETRRVLNDASTVHAEKFAWDQYREAEVLYAQALQRCLDGDLTKGEVYVREATAKAFEAIRGAEKHMRKAKQSISFLLELLNEFSKSEEHLHEVREKLDTL